MSVMSVILKYKFYGVYYMKWYDIYNWNGSQSSIVKFQIKVYVYAFIAGLIVSWAL